MKWASFWLVFGLLFACSTQGDPAPGQMQNPREGDEMDRVLQEDPPTGWQQYQIHFLYPSVEPPSLDLDNGEFRVNQIPGEPMDGGWSFRINSPRAPMVSFNIPGIGNYPSRKNGWFILASKVSWIRDGILYLNHPESDIDDQQSFNVLTLNLHTYQESDSSAKLELVGRLMSRAHIDAALFQEMAQNREAQFWDRESGLREDHMIHPISRGAASLEESFPVMNAGVSASPEHFVWDWAHYGWNVWEEGLGIYTNTPSGPWESRYVSPQKNRSSIDSRLALCRETATALGQNILLVSTHLSWGDVQKGQLQELVSLVQEKGLPAIIGGDFNMRPNTENYRYLTEEVGWRDVVQELALEHSQQSTFENGDRIDYLFLTPDFPLIPLQLQRVFTHSGSQEEAFQRVSDHYGLIVRFVKSSQGS